ncbi:hypothetical protein TcBrA4_0054290 [Trypanosoma cruzi]|nr:hypothetical protein TcBrA4_0054290 [Trypanosoma cruzi]
MANPKLPKPKLLTLRQKLKRVTVLLLLFIAATTVLFFRLDTTADDDASGPNNPRHSRAAAADDAALAYISRQCCGHVEPAGVPGCAGYPLHGRRSEANTTQPAAEELLAVPRSGDEGERLHRCDARAVRPWATPVARLRILCRAAGGGEAVAGCVCATNERGPRDDEEKDLWRWLVGDEAEIGMTRKVYMWFDLALRLFRQRVTFRRAMTTCFSACAVCC